MEKIYRKNCPLCGGTNFENSFNDWQGNSFVQCHGCGLIIQNPCLQAEYEQSYWQESIDPDGKNRNLLLERDFKLKNWYGGIVSFINNQPSGNVLDVGCGPGFLLSAVEKRHKKYGVEISDVCLEHIRTEYPEIELHKGMLDSTVFPAEYFDIAVLYHTLEHLADPVSFMGAIKKIVKKGGIVIIGLPNIGSFCAKRFMGNFRLLGKGHLTMFSENTLKALLNKIGFEVIKKDAPFFKTDYFTVGNLIRLFDTAKISPPFYGNIMTFYARKRD